MAAIAGTAAVRAGVVGRGIGAGLLAGLAACNSISIRTGGVADAEFRAPVPALAALCTGQDVGPVVAAVRGTGGRPAAAAGPWRAAALALVELAVAGARALVAGGVSIATALGSARR